MVVEHFLWMLFVLKWKKYVVAAIWYEPTNEEKDCKCKIKVDIARNMLHPNNFTPNKDSFFYDGSEIESPQANLDKD